MLSNRLWNVRAGLTLVLVLGLTILTGLAWGEPATKSGAEARMSSDELTMILSLPRLAERGNFDQVHQMLLRKSGEDDVLVATLIKDLELYAQHEEAWEKARLAAYNDAMLEMAKLVKEGSVQKALYSAIEAHALSKDQDGFLQTGPIVSLVQAAEAEITTAVEKGHWLDKLLLYRSLDFLFDSTGRYRDKVRESERRLSLIRFYAPEEYVKIIEERAKRQNDEDFTPPKLDDTTWKERLEGVNPLLVRGALAHAARLHVTRPGYAPLLAGGLESLDLLVSTRELSSTFRSVGDANKVQAFRDSLRDLRDQVKRGGKNLSFIDVVEVLEDLDKANDTTVELPKEVLLFELTNGAMSTLDDFSSVIWPYELKQFDRHLQGKFYGVGIQIEKRDNRLTVVSPLEGTPAHQAGIKAGDVIAQVDGKDTSDWSLDRAVREITGPEGTPVTLGIERKGVKGVMPITVKRAEIVIESVRGWERKASGGWEYYVDPEFRIGYVRVSQFIPQTDTDMVAAVNQMQRDRGLNALVLDVRGNPGGLLSSAIDVVDRFIEKGPVVSTVGPDDGRNRSYSAHEEQTLGQFPVVVLTNEGSASASEIVSGALQDYGRALVVGKRTFGKGSVQDPYPIDQGRARLKLTTQYYKLPEGRIIHRTPESLKWGIEPDLEVDITAKQFTELRDYRQEIDILRDEVPIDPTKERAKALDILTKGMDPQLEAALLVLKTRLISRDLAVAHVQKNPAPATP